VDLAPPTLKFLENFMLATNTSLSWILTPRSCR